METIEKRLAEKRKEMVKVFETMDLTKYDKILEEVNELQKTFNLKYGIE